MIGYNTYSDTVSRIKQPIAYSDTVTLFHISNVVNVSNMSCIRLSEIRCSHHRLGSVCSV